LIKFFGKRDVNGISTTKSTTCRQSGSPIGKSVVQCVTPYARQCEDGTYRTRGEPRLSGLAGKHTRDLDQG
jgi:hypothetical protein